MMQSQRLAVIAALAISTTHCSGVDETRLITDSDGAPRHEEPSPEVPVGHQPEPGSTIIAPEVVIVSDEALATLTIDGDVISFPVGPTTQILADSRPGTVLVSGAGDGFIRRVREVSVEKALGVGDRVDLQTEIGTLLDVLIQSPVDYCSEVTLGPFTTGDQDLFGGEVAQAESSVNVTLESKAELCIRWRIRDRTVEFLQATLSGPFTLSYQAKASLKASVEFDRRAVLWRAPPVRTLVAVPGLPFPIPTLVQLRLEGHIVGSADATVSFANGFRYRAAGSYGVEYMGDWSVIDRREVAIEPITPVITTEANARAQAVIASILDIRLLGLGGPTLSFEPYIALDLKVCAQRQPPYEWSLEGGAVGEASGVFDLFGLGGSIGPYPFVTLGPATLANGPAGADNGCGCECPEGEVCKDNMCVDSPATCGGRDQPCCTVPSREACDTDYSCQDGACRECGAANEPCCNSASRPPCDGALASCVEGTCQDTYDDSERLCLSQGGTFGGHDSLYLRCEIEGICFPLTRYVDVTYSYDWECIPRDGATCVDDPGCQATVAATVSELRQAAENNGLFETSLTACSSYTAMQQASEPAYHPECTGAFDHCWFVSSESYIEVRNGLLCQSRVFKSHEARNDP